MNAKPGSRSRWVAVALLLGAGGVFAETEPNDNAATANTMPINGSTSGRLGDLIAPNTDDNFDWFRIVAATDGKLKISVTRISGILDVQPYIYRMVTDTNNPNSTGDWVSPAGDSLIDSVMDVPHAGIYYVQILRRSGDGDYALLSEFSPAALADDPEVNDTPSVARTLSLNAPFSGHMGYYSNRLGYDRYDWFKFTLNDEGRLNFTAQTSDGDLDIRIFIYRRVTDTNNVNSNGDWIGSTGNARNDTVFDYLRPGVYYAQITRLSGTGSYTFNPTFTQAALASDPETNDMPSAGQNFTLNAPFKGRLGYYSSPIGTDQYDWFRFTLADEGRLSFTSQTSDGNLDLRIYLFRRVTDTNNVNSNGDWIGSVGNALNDTVVDFLQPGAYYVQISRISGVGSYSINPVYAQAALAADPEANNTAAQALTLPLDSARQGRMGYYASASGSDNYDWYAITVPSIQSLTIRTQTVGGLDVRLFLYSTVSDMNAQNPGGNWTTGTGDAVSDSVVISAIPGTTYYLQIVQGGGVGSYAVASGSASGSVALQSVVNQSYRRNAPLTIRFFDLNGRTAPAKAGSASRFQMWVKKGGNL